MDSRRSKAEIPGNVQSLRRLPDWIDSFLEWTEGIPSPQPFRLWSGIAAVAGALERRVWARTSRALLYPNLYTLLVAPPGVGKSQAITRTGELWLATRTLKVAPDNVTKAALVDAIARAYQKRIISETTLVDYHSLAVPASEFGVLVPAHDLEFLNVLNHLYDNPASYREERRGFGDNQIDITRPGLNILGGTQPAYLANLLPEEAWGMGFMTRIIMVYSSTPINVPLFGGGQIFSNADVMEKALVADLKTITGLYGEVSWEPEAMRELQRWSDAGCLPVPEHSKLENYNARRILHTLKLSIIAAVSRSNELRVTLQDVNRARDWLLGAEQVMPDIFREMVGRSDAAVIQELHLFLWQLWSKGGRKAVHNSFLYRFLSTRVPSDKVQRVLDLAERSGMIAREAGTSGDDALYVPKPKTDFGVE